MIDINYYPTKESQHANLRHRPVGLGLMGYQDALHKLGVPIESDEATEFADRSMEAISYFAILASSKLAVDRGTYQSYSKSKWDRGLLPIDTIDLLEKQRGESVGVDRSLSMDWQVVRDHIAEHGMRNSNCLAIAPTATISTIVGVSQSIEPTYKHLYSKSNLSGEFTQISECLVDALKDRQLWDKDMLASLKHYDGSLAEIERIPIDLKRLFESTVDVNAHGIQPRWMKSRSESSDIRIDRAAATKSGPAVDHVGQATACSVAAPDCEACQ